MNSKWCNQIYYFYVLVLDSTSPATIVINNSNLVLLIQINYVR